MRPCVVYLRCAPGEQNKPALRIDAQLDAVRQFVLSEHYDIVAVMAEHVADRIKWDGRPVLHSAVNKARRQHCPMIVSRLDRLSRDLMIVLHVANEVTVIDVELGNSDNFGVQVAAIVANDEDNRRRAGKPHDPTRLATTLARWHG